MTTQAVLHSLQCYKKRKRLIEEKQIGEEDYPISNDKWTDRYETLVSVRQNPLFENQYEIYEVDKIKGERVTIIDKNTGIIWE